MKLPNPSPPDRVDREERLEAGDVSASELRDNLRVLDRIHRWLGTFRSIVRLCSKLATNCDDSLTVLDVGAGTGYLGEYLFDALDHPIEYTRVEPNFSILDNVPRALSTDLQTKSPGLPFGDESFDVVVSTLVLHHLNAGERPLMLEETYRVARQGVVHHDLRRSRVGYWMTWLVLQVVTSNSIAQHDGPLSVLRSCTVDEWRDLVSSHGLPYNVRRTWPWRVELTAQKKSN